MLNRLRRKWQKLLAIDRERNEISRLRPQLERLEDRTMLSATHGPPPHSHAGGNSGPHSAGGPKFAEQSAYTSTPHQSNSRQSRSYAPAPDLNPSFSGIQDRSLKADRFQEPPQSIGGFQDRLQPVESFADRSPYSGGIYNSPPVQTAFAPPPRQPSYETSWTYEPVWEQLVFEPTPTVYEVVFDPPTVHQPEYRSPSTGVSNPPPLMRLTTVFVVERIVTSIAPPRPAPDLQSPIFASIDLPRDPVPSATNTLAFASSIANALPATATEQVLVRDGSTAAILAATARDLVFKDYAPNLLLLSTSTAFDRTNLALVGTEARQTEGLDGLIQPHEPSIVDDIVRSTDSVTQEREAVNAVLEQLQDVDSQQASDTRNGDTSLSGDSANNDPELRLDLLDAENIADEMPVGEVQDGMVLLPSTGDANESKFDLTPVYAEHVERFTAPSVETSVGLFQAVDVTADDTAAAETAQPADAIVLPKNQILLNDPPPAERAQPTSRKSAALIGAATLTGALVWMSRSGGQRDASRTTAPKRHVRRI
jgi:hypothetical protein